MRLFFFFGSLREGYWNQRVLSKDARKICTTQTREPFALYIDEHGTVPTAVPGEGKKLLWGDVYALNEKDAHRVETLEYGYKSKTILVELDDESLVDATIYYHDKAGDCPYIRKPVLVPNGDYTTVVSKTGGRL